MMALIYAACLVLLASAALALGSTLRNLEVFKNEQ